jgi:hypothetical protein
VSTQEERDSVGVHENVIDGIGSREQLGTIEAKRRRLVAGVDLNHRPLGFEFKGKMVLSNLQAHG